MASDLYIMVLPENDGLIGLLLTKAQFTAMTPDHIDADQAMAIMREAVKSLGPDSDYQQGRDAAEKAKRKVLAMAEDARVEEEATEMNDHRLKTGPAVNMTDILPELPAEEYETLKASIADNGVQMPIVMDQHHQVIDGKARWRASGELGIECPCILRYVESETERLQLRLQLNCNRRHFTPKQKREMIAAYLKTDPQIGNRELGEIIGCLEEHCRFGSGGT